MTALIPILAMLALFALVGVPLDHLFKRAERNESGSAVGAFVLLVCWAGFFFGALTISAGVWKP